MYYKTLYHCTTKDSYFKILQCGFIKPNHEEIYLSTDPVAALMFTYMHHVSMSILQGMPIQWLYMFEIDGDVLDWEQVTKGSDHSPPVLSRGCCSLQRKHFSLFRNQCHKTQFERPSKEGITIGISSPMRSR